MSRFIQSLGLSLLLAASMAGGRGSAQEKNQITDNDRLVPAALGIRTDKQGNSWNVEQNGTIGRVGSAKVNSGLALMIDNEKFVSFQPMMTSDGGEFVLQGRPVDDYPGLQVQRRIALMEDAGGLRYAEFFYNGSTDPMSINVGLATNFSGNYKTFLTDRGRTEPVILDGSETGIVVLPGSSQSTKAYLFTLAGPDADTRPTISAQNRYGLEFQYRLELAPGETAVLVHNVAQVVIPQNFDRRTLLKLFSPLSFSETSEFIDDDWSEKIANVAHSGGTDLFSRSAASLSDTLGIEPVASDILASGSETRLLGEAKGAGAVLSEEFGNAEIPLSSIAAIVGKNGQPEKTPRVFLKDGQVFSSEIDTPNLQFVQKSGENIALSPDTLDRLVMAESTDSEADWSADGLALVETHRGDRFKIGKGSDFTLTGITPWGNLPVALDDLIWVIPGSKQTLGHRIELRDGTDCLVLFPEEEIGVTLEGIGDYVLLTSRLRSIFTPASEGASRFSEPVFTDSLVQLTGNQSVAGSITNKTIPIVSAGGVIESAVGEIHRIERVGGASGQAGIAPVEMPEFRIERWDGGIVSGYLQLDLLTLNVGGENWEIPVQDLRKLETASPELTDEVLGKIKTLVAQLGADDWSTREKATRELGAFGYLARSTLQRELSSATDPEVTRRIERVLAELN